MKTEKIAREEIAELEVLAEGYKVVKHDLSTNGTSKFRYGQKGENIVGTVWKCDGDITECRWGLHFSKDPANVFNFYEPFGYNRYFKVRAYGKVEDAQDGMKTVAQIIKFVEEYDVMQYIEIIKKFDRSVKSDDISVSYSNAVSDSYAVRSSYAVSYSNAVSDSYAIYKSEAVKNCLFCYGIEAKKHCLFNQSVKKERFEEVHKKILSFNYFPKYDNFYDLKGNKEWWTLAFPDLMSVDNATAWSKMPKEMDEYLRSLPEFNEKIYLKITGNERRNVLKRLKKAQERR